MMVMMIKHTVEARLDKFWENQDVRYNWKADLSFTGSRSKAVTLITKSDQIGPSRTKSDQVGHTHYQIGPS